jgi:hypothetical protein
MLNARERISGSPGVAVPRRDREPRRNGMKGVELSLGGCRLTRPGYKCHPDAGRGTTRRGIDVLRFVVGLTADVGRRRAGLVAENALLRQQLIVAQRKIAGRVRWAGWQRCTMGLAARLAPARRTASPIHTF